MTLEAALTITILVPLLFAVLEFGDTFQRWLAQDFATLQAARHAGEVGGDGPEVRARLAEALQAAGIDPAGTIVRIEPSQVGWREPVRVSVTSERPVTLPFAFATSLTLRSSATARGEIAR